MSEAAEPAQDQLGMDGNVKPHQIRMRSALDLMDLCLGCFERTKIFCGVPLLALDQIQVGVKIPYAGWQLGGVSAEALDAKSLGL